MDNTGYKIATKIKVTKKSGNSVSERMYPIGKYKGDEFVPYSSEELAKLFPEEYKKCIQDTKLYILTEEEMENMGDFLNDNMVQDFEMCPLPLPIDAISVSGEVDSNNYIWLTFTSKYEVASDIVISTTYEDTFLPNKIVLLKGHKTVTQQQDPNRGGTIAKFDLNIKDSLLKEDATYKYSIQPTILIPKLNIIDNKFNPVIRVFEDKVQLTYKYSVALQVSNVVIRVSINENGVESYFDITKIAGDGTTNMYDVPEKFWGKTANVKIYSVDGVVGKDTDSRYHYVVDPTVEIPNRKVMTENKLSATVSVKSGEVYVTIRSKYPVDSDLMLSLEDTYPYYPQINKGEDEVVVKMRTSSYGKTLWGNIYSVNGVFGMYYDDKYRYVFEQNISIPSDPFIDNTPGYDFINKNGSLVVAVDFPNPVDNNVDFYFRGLSDESTHTCSSGEKHKEFEVSPLDYGKRIQLMIISVGGNDKVYGDYLRGDKYKYKDLGEKKVVPSI